MGEVLATLSVVFNLANHVAKERQNDSEIF